MTTDTHAAPQHWQLIALTPALGDISFSINTSMSVGRQDSNDVVLATPQISRRHAKFNQVGNNLFLQDLGSSNGTFVNGERISTQAVQLQPNDEVAFADLVFVVAQEDSLEDTLLNQASVIKQATGLENTPQATAPTSLEPSTLNPSINTTYPLTDSAITITNPTNTPVTSPLNSGTIPTATLNPVTLNTDTLSTDPIVTESVVTKPVVTETAMTNKTLPTATVPVTPSNALTDTTIPITSSNKDSSPSKSPMLWIIAVIILLIIAGVVISGR